MRLTSRNVRSLDPGEYRDEKVPGLILRVTDSSRAWGFRYTFATRRSRVDLGPLERDPEKVGENIEQARDLAPKSDSMRCKHYRSAMVRPTGLEPVSRFRQGTPH